MNILITTSTFGKYDPRPLAMLEEAGFSYSVNPYGRKVTKEEFLSLIGDSVGVIAGTETIDAQVLKRIPKVKAISRCGTGLDNVDLTAARELSIAVTHTPDTVTVAVAELTVGLVLSLLRKTFVMDRQVKAGQWEKMMGHLLSGKNIGIIGFGRIGRKVGQLFSCFKTKIGYYDVIKTPCPFAAYMEMEELCGWADILCLHVSKPAGGGYLFDKERISKIKQGAWIVNCSRGGVIHEEFLCEALVEGRLSGAAVDVFEKEPYNGPLTKLDNVILTPHIGSYAKEARVKMEIEAVQNLIKSLRSEK